MLAVVVVVREEAIDRNRPQQGQERRSRPS